MEKIRETVLQRFKQKSSEGSSKVGARPGY
jgi:hypothetical protein